MPVGQIKIWSYNILSALQSRDVRCKLWNVLGILSKVACDYCALQDSMVTVLCGRNPRDILRVAGMYVTREARQGLEVALWPFPVLLEVVETNLAIGSKEQNGMLNQSGRLWVEGHFSGLSIDHVTSKLLRFCSVASTKHVLSCLHVEILLSHMPLKTVLR